MSAKTLKIAVAIVAIGALASGAVYMMNGPQDAQASQEAQNAGQAPQAMPVSVTTVTPQKIQLWKNFSGHVVAVDQAQIKPQVSGRITEIRFEDGGHVDKGDILIVIDPRPYEAKVNQAKALLDAAQTQSSLAEKEYQRAVQLIDSDAIAQSVMDTRVNNRRTAAAALQGAKATLEAARVDLDYAYIKAPIAGKISRAEMTQGNLVQSGPNAPVLTSIVADEKVYADFEVDEATYIATLKGGAAALSDIPVRLQVPGADQEYLGTVQSFDNRIDQATGTIRARAIFDNANGLLLPGMTVGVLMGENGDSDKILISERAIGTDQDRKFVLIVNDQSAAEYREVTIGESLNGQRVILSGLQSGDTVITEGLVRIRPGMPVSPKAQEEAAAAAVNDIGPPPAQDEAEVQEIKEVREIKEDTPKETGKP